ncbi:DMT family transporter [bacterium]|nr:DMT family transporter [bacterium]
MGIFWVFLSYSFNGCSITICKIILQYASPLFSLGIRMTIAGLLLLGFHRFILKKKISVPKKAIYLLVQSTLCNIFIPYALRFWAIQYVTATKTSFFYNLGPISTYTIAWMMGMEKGSWTKILGLSIGFLSIIPLVVTSSASEKALGSFLCFSLPEIALLTSIVAFSYSWVLIQNIVRTYDISPFLLNGIHTFFSGILALVFSFALHTDTTISHPWEFAGWTAIIIFITNIICYNLYAIFLKKFSSTLLTFISLTMPFFASFSAWLYFGEKLSWNNIFSFAIVIAGLTIFHNEKKIRLYFAIKKGM